jgi:PilZ domain
VEEIAVREQRKHERRLTLKTANIHFDVNGEERECAVLDLSDAGACVIVASTTDVPDTFALTTDRDGLTRECKVVWRKGNRLGLSFKGSPHCYWQVR